MQTSTIKYTGAGNGVTSNSYVKFREDSKQLFVVMENADSLGQHEIFIFAKQGYPSTFVEQSKEQVFCDLFTPYSLKKEGFLSNSDGFVLSVDGFDPAATEMYTSGAGAANHFTYGDAVPLARSWRFTFPFPATVSTWADDVMIFAGTT